MKKKIMIFLIGLILLTTTAMVSSIEPTKTLNVPRGNCNWTRIPTLSQNYELVNKGILWSISRDYRNFTGVWGRFSDGTIRCTPTGRNNNRLKTSTKTSTTTNNPPNPEPTCKEKTICEYNQCHKLICHKITTCNYE